MRGDDFTTNLTMHHNVIYNCGMGPAGSDGMGQSFGAKNKHHFLRHYISVKTVILPRQARDKHRENSKKECFRRRRAQGRLQ
jgi:hypothetical protein